MWRNAGARTFRFLSRFRGVSSGPAARARRAVTASLLNSVAAASGLRDGRAASGFASRLTSGRGLIDARFCVGRAPLPAKARPSGLPFRGAWGSRAQGLLVGRVSRGAAQGLRGLLRAPSLTKVRNFKLSVRRRFPSPQRAGQRRFSSAQRVRAFRQTLLERRGPMHSVARLNPLKTDFGRACNGIEGTRQWPTQSRAGCLRLEYSLASARNACSEARLRHADEVS